MRAASVEAFLFDLDGVLVDTTRIIHTGWTRFAAARGLIVPEEDYPRAIYGRRTREILIDYFGLGPDEADSLISEGFDDKTDIVRDQGLAEIPGACDFVRMAGLQPLRLALVTSASPANVLVALEALQLADLFDVVITSADVRAGKPAPDPYLTAAQALGVEPRRALVFEDTIPGIKAAHAAGSRCVALATTMQRADLSEADLVVDDFRGLDPAQVIRDLGA